MHTHIWKRDLVLNRYSCACGVKGFTAQTFPGQYRTDTKYVKPYLCQYELAGRKHCGAEAVHVTGNRAASRCADHAPRATETAHV